jgi:hypothetical protein
MTILGELLRAMGRGGELLATGTVAGPTLTSGDFTIDTGLTNVRDFEVSEQVREDTDDFVQSHSAVESAGIITVTVSKQQISATNTWGDAVTADVSASTFRWKAIGT